MDAEESSAIPDRQRAKRVVPFTLKIRCSLDRGEAVMPLHHVTSRPVTSLQLIVPADLGIELLIDPSILPPPDVWALLFSTSQKREKKMLRNSGFCVLPPAGTPSQARVLLFLVPPIFISLFFL